MSIYVVLTTNLYYSSFILFSFYSLSFNKNHLFLKPLFFILFLHLLFFILILFVYSLSFILYPFFLILYHFSGIHYRSFFNLNPLFNLLSFILNILLSYNFIVNINLALPILHIHSLFFSTYTLSFLFS